MDTVVVLLNTGAQPLPASCTYQPPAPPSLSLGFGTTCVSPFQRHMPPPEERPLCAAAPALSSPHLTSTPRARSSFHGGHKVGGRGRVPLPSPRCEGSEPHAAGGSADTLPLRQMWKQPVGTFLCEGAAGTGGCPRLLPPPRQLCGPAGHSSCHGGLARAGTGGGSGTARRGQKQHGESRDVNNSTPSTIRHLFLEGPWMPSPSTATRSCWVHQRAPGQEPGTPAAAGGLRNGDHASQPPRAALSRFSTRGLQSF